MENVLQVNSMHLNYLRPLLKWRIMDIKTLWEECEFNLGYDNFYRIIRNLEKKKVLESHVDHYTKRKYLFLGKEGEQLLHHDFPTSISKETFIHDLKASEISRFFLESKFINEVSLEHQIINKSNFKIREKLIPDALFIGSRNQLPYRMAFELELSKKSNSRLTEKARMYLNSSHYDYVMYFFAQDKFIEKYLELFEKELDHSFKNKFMFFCNHNLTGKITDLAQSKGVFRDKEVMLSDLFKDNESKQPTLKSV